MKPIKLIVTFFLLFIICNSFAQRVHYKDNYYTLVNSKIFHLGHNVYGSLTPGARDTIYIIARELYDKKGKLKPQYKNRRKRNRYKLPEGFWEAKVGEENVIEEESSATKVEQKIINVIEDNQKEVIVKEQESQKNNLEEKSEEKEEKLKESEKQKEQEKADRQERKEDKKEKKAEKKEKKKEKAIDRHEDAKKRLKKVEKKYQKLKAKGELSPNDEEEWLDKIEKLKEKVEKAKKKAKRA